MLNTEANWKGVRLRGERLYRLSSSMQSATAKNQMCFEQPLLLFGLRGRLL